MDEMTLLEEFRAAVAPPGEAVLARARAGMTGGAPGLHHPAQRRLHWPRTRGKLALTGLAVTVTAAAVAVAMTAAPASEPSPAGSVSPVVKEMAYRVAAAAAAGPAVAPGQWVYWQDKTPDETYEIWTTADGTRAAYVYQGKVAFVPCIGPHGKRVASCQFIGQPDVGPVKAGGIGIGALTGPMPVPYVGLSSLPRDPVALDRYFAGLLTPGDGPAPVRAFRVIEDLLITYVMPPTLTAELYRALGNIPGVTVDQHAADIAGRHGIGFRIALPAGQGAGFDELILDPRTFALMGQQATLGPAAGAKAGQVIGGVAITKSALVSGPGRMP
jgi:RNA polymerase sigma-70 factor (ECF subfamily)